MVSCFDVPFNQSNEYHGYMGHGHDVLAMRNLDAAQLLRASWRIDPFLLKEWKLCHQSVGSPSGIRVQYFFWNSKILDDFKQKIDHG